MSESFSHTQRILSVSHLMQMIETRTELALQICGVGIWDWWLHYTHSDNDTILVSDRRFAQLLGSSTSELSSIENFEKFICPEDLAFFRQSWSDALNNKCVIDAVIKLNNGKLVRMIGGGVDFEDGKASRMAGILLPCPPKHGKCRCSSV